MIARPNGNGQGRRAGGAPTVAFHPGNCYHFHFSFKENVKENRDTLTPSTGGQADRGSERSDGSASLELAYLNLVQLKPGTMVNNRYRLEKLIGQGGFGIVFEALDATLNSRVALKFLNPKLTANEKKFLRVQREINLSRRISDERIIKIFSLESWQDIHFLVMELASGSSLRSFLEKRGCCRWPDFKPIFLDIVEAIAILHRNGIIHRDLKPANILIDGEQRVKILDFGLAKEIEDMEKTSSVGEIVGSPYYMSPEQIRGGAIGFPSDVYQMGLVLYRTLSGRHPFEHPSTMEVIFRQLNQRPEPLAPVDNGLPRFLRLGLDKALEKSPARRFRDAGAMAAFFRKEKLSLPRRLLLAAQGGPWRWGLAALALAALLALGYFATFGSRAVHALRNNGSRLEARNRFGVRLWRKDFSPFAVYFAYPTRTSTPEIFGTGKQSADLRLRLGERSVILVILTPPPAPVFPATASITSPVLFSQRVLLDQGGKKLKQEPFLLDYEFDTYDYVKVVKPHMVTLLPGDTEREAEALATVQQYQSMYPSAMVYMRGIKKYVFTHPGTFAVTPLVLSGERASFMLFGINNLFAHMSFVAEIGFNAASDDDQVIKGVPNLFSDERSNIPYENKLFILPARAKMIENHWRDQGRAVFSEDTRGDVMEVDSDGRIVLHAKNGPLAFRDPPDILRRVFTLVNIAFQEKMLKCNLEGALASIRQAVSLPLQNPFLLSALLYMQGDLEIRLGRYAAGEKTLLRSLELYQGNNDACERLCEMDVLKGDPAAALKRLAGSYTDSTEFWGFGSFGVQLFRSYVFLNTGSFSKAEDEFAKIRLTLPDIAQYGRAAVDLFKGNSLAALAAVRDLEKWPLGALDLRELRLLLGRALLLADTDLPRAKFLFDDIFRNSLEFGHLAEISTCYFLARSGRATEAAQAAREAFTRLRARARGDFMARLWLFYDAFIYGRTMELAGDPIEATNGYRACIEANPHTELAERSRRQLKKLQRPR